MPFQITRDVYVFQSSIWQTNSSVILNEAANVVIDPCYFPPEIQVIASFTERKKSFNKYIIFTHSDFDHIVGYLPFKGAKLIAHEEFLKADRESQADQLAEIDDIYQVQRRPAFVFPKPDIVFHEGYRLPIRGDELILYHAPGHTADSVFTVSRARGILFAGDYLSNLEFPFVYHRISSYLETLALAGKLIRDFDIRCLVPGHGDLAEGRSEMTDRLAADTEYLEVLADRAADLCRRGLTEPEIIEVMRDMRFRQEPIEGAMQKMHIENVRQAIEEFNPPK